MKLAWLLGTGILIGTVAPLRANVPKDDFDKCVERAEKDYARCLVVNANNLAALEQCYPKKMEAICECSIKYDDRNGGSNPGRDPNKGPLISQADGSKNY